MMDIKDFISVSGQSGLFRMISQGKNMLIAENLETGHRLPVHASSRVSSLEEIAVFTDTEDKPLKEVLVEMHRYAEGKPAPDPKKLSNDQIRDFFGKVLPAFDREKVYVSDMKKILTWYNLLLAHANLDWTLPVEEPESDSAESPDEPSEEGGKE